MAANCCRPRRTSSTSWVCRRSCDRPGGPSISLGEIARHLAPDSPTLATAIRAQRRSWFRTSHMTYPYGVQIAVVRVDGETGEVTVERYLIAYDIGRAINPLLAEGQLVVAWRRDWAGRCTRNSL